MKYAMTLVLLIFIAGCGPARLQDNPDPIQHEETILLLDRSYKPYLKVVSQKMRRLDSGQLEVIVEIQNTRKKDLWSDIQVIFKDQDGVEVDKTNWEPLMFHRREVTTYKKVSLTDEASDYRLVIRKPKTES